MPSPNNAEFFSGARNTSIYDGTFSNTTGHVSVIINNSPQENSNSNPVVHGRPAPSKSNNLFTPNGNGLEATESESPLTNSSNESESYSVPFSRDGPLQHQELPSAMRSSSWSSTNNHFVGLISDNESDFPPSETMSRGSNSDEMYVKAMLSLRRGYPLPTPQPISCLPIEKRRVGTIVGDVGTIRDDGSFDYLFNPLLPTTDPRNPHDLPTTFEDFSPPVSRTFQVRSAINSRTAVCSLGSHCDTNRETMYIRKLGKFLSGNMNTQNAI